MFSSIVMKAEGLPWGILAGRALAPCILTAFWAVACMAGPRLTCPEPICRFGTKTNDSEDVRAEFLIRNTGDEPAKIGIDPMGCGCNLSTLSTNLIGPGETVHLDAVLPLRGRRGPVMTRFMVKTAPPNSDRLLLGFEGYVHLPVVVEPGRFLFGVMSSGCTSICREAAIRFNSLGRDSVTGLSISSPCYTGVWAEVRRGREYRIAVSTVPPALPSNGICQATASVHTVKRGPNGIVIPIEGRVTSDPVIAFPDVFAVPTDFHPPLTLHAMVECRGAESGRVIGASLSCSGVQARVRPMAGNTWQISVSGILSPTMISGAVLKVHTDVRDYEELIIPFVIGADKRP